MGILDIVLLICFVPAIVQGISKGFVQQAISLISILVGVWTAGRFSSMVVSWLSSYFTIDPRLLNIISFTIIVVVAILLLYWIGQLLTKVIKIATLGWLNRLLGVVLSIVTTALLLGLLILLFEGINAKFELVKPTKLEDASVYCALRDFGNKVFPFLKSLISGIPNA